MALRNSSTKRTFLKLASVLLLIFGSWGAAHATGTDHETVSHPVELSLPDTSDPIQGTGFMHVDPERADSLIRLSQYQFDPLIAVPGPRSGIPYLDAYAPEELGYFIVQFDGPIQSEWKRTLEESGVELFDYLPDFSFVVRMDIVDPNFRTVI